MSFATAVTWFFNFVVSITFPALLGAFTPQGAFGWYAAWNIIGWVAVLLAVPETKALSLEELDQGEVILWSSDLSLIAITSVLRSHKTTCNIPIARDTHTL